jgi:hypothetical protein
MTQGCVLVFRLVYMRWGGAQIRMPKSKSQTEGAYNNIAMYGNMTLLN